MSIEDEDYAARKFLLEIFGDKQQRDEMRREEARRILVGEFQSLKAQVEEAKEAPAFECSKCKYVSDEAGDTHTHPTPEHVTLTDEERANIHLIVCAHDEPGRTKCPGGGLCCCSAAMADAVGRVERIIGGRGIQ